MYIAIRTIPLVCPYIHECHKLISPYFFCAHENWAQRWTDVLWNSTKHLQNFTRPQRICRGELGRHNICIIVHYGHRQTHIPQSLSLIITRERKLISSSVSSQISPSRPPHIVKYHSRAEHDPNCKSFSSVYSNPLRLHRVCSVFQPPPLWRDISRRTSVVWQLPCIVQSEYSYLFISVHI